MGKHKRQLAELGDHAEPERSVKKPKHRKLAVVRLTQSDAWTTVPDFSTA